ADEARLITAAAQGKMLSQVVDLNEDAQIAYQLRWLRKKKQLTQTEVAAQVGMTQSQLAKIERAQVEVSLPRLRRLLQAVGGDLEWRVVS
ncbi:MAG: helix-turn-helix domain-containing protein, partial [Bacillota bacterium]|nr:helix-turn-helix domain-containing protein [Bacillota bacterium]